MVPAVSRFQKSFHRGMVMAVIHDAKCGECGKGHTFILTTGDFFDGNAEYEYKCPETQLTARKSFSSPVFDQVIQHRPAGSVEVRKV